MARARSAQRTLSSFTQEDCNLPYKPSHKKHAECERASGLKANIQWALLSKVDRSRREPAHCPSQETDPEMAFGVKKVLGEGKPLKYKKEEVRLHQGTA